MEELSLNLTFTHIKQMSKEDWKNMIKESIVDKAFRNLNEAKQKHSKVMKLEYKNLEMHSYFSPNKLECSQEDTLFIFKVRTNMTNVKMNGHTSPEGGASEKKVSHPRIKRDFYF